MPESLDTLIAEKLELDPEEVEHLLSDYVRKLEKSIRAGEANHIEGFGAFEWKDARIQFTPDEALSQLVNYRYRSLSALSATPWTDEQADEELETPAAAIPDTTAGTAADTAAKTLDAPPREEVTDTTEIDDGLEKTFEVVDGVWDAAIFTDTGKSEEVGVDRPPVTAPSKKLFPSQSAVPRSSKMPYIVLPLLAIVVAAMAYFLLDGGLKRPTEDISSQSQVDTPGGETETNEAQTTPARDSPDEVLDDGLDEAIAQEDPGARKLAVTRPPAPHVEPTGEFVSIFTRQTSGYTLIVGRSSSLDDADNQIRRYSSLGLPLAIVEYEDNGITRFRLAVGRYDTIDDAQQDMQNLDSQLPGGTWIRRIRLLFSN